MLADFTWLSQEAKRIHDIFQICFYSLVTLFLLVGIFAEYFKWPLGAVPSFMPLVGRVFIAVFLLHSFTEMTNYLADFVDGLSNKLGDLNSIHLVLQRMGQKIHELTWSWISIKDSITLLLSFVTFFLLYFSVYIANAFILYSWTLLYVFSPLLIGLFVLPSTSQATKALYRSLVEVSCWKIVWSVLATLMWSAALSQINQAPHEINFLTSVCFNLILAGSLLITPLVVHGLAGAGVAGIARTLGSIAIGTAVLGPAGLLSGAGAVAKRSYNMGHSAVGRVTKSFFPAAHKKFTRNIPRIRVQQHPSFFEKPRK